MLAKKCISIGETTPSIRMATRNMMPSCAQLLLIRLILSLKGSLLRLAISSLKRLLSSIARFVVYKNAIKNIIVEKMLPSNTANALSPTLENKSDTEKPIEKPFNKRKIVEAIEPRHNTDPIYKNKSPPTLNRSDDKIDDSKLGIFCANELNIITVYCLDDSNPVLGSAETENTPHKAPVKRTNIKQRYLVKWVFICAFILRFVFCDTK